MAQDTDPQQGINALTTLRQHIKDSAPSLEEKLDKDYSLRQPLQRDEKDTRGKDFFSKIYGQHTEKVLHNLSVASGGDLAEFAINAVYGDLMAETSRFDAMQTSLLEFVACYATGGTTTLQAKAICTVRITLATKKQKLELRLQYVTPLKQRCARKSIGPAQNGHGSRRQMDGETRHDMPFASVP
jgi:hypothetical protein